MKKTVKIIVFLILIAFAVVFSVSIFQYALDSYHYIRGLLQFKTYEYVKDMIRARVSITLAQIGVLLVVLFNAFFILFDFYFQGPIFDFQAKIKANYEAKREKIKANRDAKREQAKQKKYDKLKSKIEKMESDE